MARQNHHTSLAATLAVGAELSRRGYDVAFTIGNTPRIDLICDVPDGTPFKVQVKGISNLNGFYVQRKFFEAPAQNDLFLVIVLVPKSDNDSFQFFVLTHREAIAESLKMPRSTRDGRVIDVHDAGLNWGSITPYEDKWESLPPLARCEGIGIDLFAHEHEPKPIVPGELRTSAPAGTSTIDDATFVRHLQGEFERREALP